MRFKTNPEIHHGVEIIGSHEFIRWRRMRTGGIDVLFSRRSSAAGSSPESWCNFSSWLVYACVLASG
ncbi:MAG: hypothetical protein ABJA67_16210, partial [Chthonomonadales bacterium]